MAAASASPHRYASYIGCSRYSRYILSAPRIGRKLQPLLPVQPLHPERPAASVRKLHGLQALHPLPQVLARLEPLYVEPLQPYPSRPLRPLHQVLARLEPLYVEPAADVEAAPDS